MLIDVWRLGMIRSVDPIECLVRVEDLKIDSSKLLAIIMKLKENEILFEGVIEEELDEEKAIKLLYRRFKDKKRHGSLTIALSVSKKILDQDLLNVLEKKIVSYWKLWFKMVKSKKELLKEASKDININKLEEAINANKEKILDSIAEKINSILRSSKRKSFYFIISIKFIINSSEKYLGDIPAFKKIFYELSFDEVFGKYGINYRGKKSRCFLCGKEKEVGPLSPFDFFTVNPVGFAYNLLREDAWKQLPICGDCYLQAEYGKRILEKFFRYKLPPGHFYYIIPSVVNIEKYSLVMEEFLDELENIRRGGNIVKELSEISERLLDTEDYVTAEVIRKFELLLTYVFCRPKSGGYFDVVGVAKEVSPSWLRIIYNALVDIPRRPPFTEDSLKKLLGYKWSGDILSCEREKGVGVLFSFIIRLFSEPLKVLNMILTRGKIQETYVIKEFIKKMRENYAKNVQKGDYYLIKSLILLSIISFFVFVFMINLNLLKWRECKMAAQEDEIKSIDDFFRMYSQAFISASRRASFLVGVFVKFLFDVQYAQRKDIPFLSKLHGLRLNSRRLKYIFREAVNKFNEYKIVYPELQQIVSKALIEAENEGWKLTDDEISYFFTLGLSMGGFFKDFFKKKEEEGSE